MQIAKILVTAAATIAAAVPVAAMAQVSLGASVEAATDERRRGISWSDGDLAPAASVRAGLPAGFDLGVRVTGTRGDPRHGGADAVAEVTGGFGGDVGSGLRLDGFVTGHLFVGAAERLDYVEGGLGASYALGPAEIGVDARYAPDQAAIGGDNLWVGARARVGVPATPFTLHGGIGHSLGSVDDPRRAARLRPGGSYADWSLGVDHITGPLTIGVDYTGTDIARDRLVASPFAGARHVGDKVTARVAVTF
ncbi:TorF family putative porin [Sphingomonas sp. TZW2008]|uniref:TorF family putative porin n=1 Tax=Sphingomonas sp. TZW2008 TaxID=1917973 RepID=UPI000A26ADC2|nr:TorF family putative porin [Sphingomonas sp. TZW2008]